MAVDTANLRRVVAASIGVTAIVQTATAVVALRRERRDYADAAWGPGLAAIAVAAATVGRGDAKRRWSLAVVAAGWAMRLERQMIGRISRSDKEDSRYTEFLEGDSTAQVVGKVFIVQGLSQLLVSAPSQLAAASTRPGSRRRWLFPAGIVVMAVGAVTEAVADRQKQRYQQRDEDQKPAVLDTGLWAWSRHPNYFGDSMVWDGAWLAAAASPPGALTILSPALMSYLLIFATGAKRTEGQMQQRAGYRDYQDRVAFFFPRPPKG